MRRVLLITFFFPPSNVVGAIRAAKLAKYLPAHGWQPTVLTVDRFRSRPQTLALEEPIPQLLRARYVDPVGALLSWRRGNAGPKGVSAGGAAGGAAGGGAGGPSMAGRLRELLRKAPGITSLHVPDRAMPWYGPAVAAGLRALRQTRYDALFSTAPPPTAHLVAGTLSRLTGVPWVADMRDLWSTFPSDEMGPWRRRLETLVERACLQSAARITTVSAPMVDDLAELHAQPVHVVTNGFDPDDVAASAPEPLDCLTLTYTGSLVPQYRDPEPLLAGIALLRERRGLAPGELDVRFYGSEHETVPPLVARYDVGDFVRFPGLVSREESLARQRESAALLVLDWNSSQERGVMTLKALEYLQARRPILVVGRRSDSYLIRRLREAGVGVACATPEDVAVTLEQWLDEFERHRALPYHGDEQVIGRYRWDGLAGQLAGILELAAG